MSNIASLEAVTKQYDSGERELTVLDELTLLIETQEFLSITGPSGSGKTTLLNLLGLLDTPTTGTVTLDGTDVSTLDIRERTRRRRSAIGFVFQDFHLHSSLTAKQNVEVPAMYRDESVDRDRSAELLERVGLGDRFDHYPGELSGGQQQRVAIARALINDPAIVLADEPTGNLDENTSQAILEELSRVRNLGATIVAVTHDPTVAEFADREVKLDSGSIRTVRTDDDPEPLGRTVDWQPVPEE